MERPRRTSSCTSSARPQSNRSSTSDLSPETIVILSSGMKGWSYRSPSGAEAPIAGNLRSAVFENRKVRARMSRCSARRFAPTRDCGQRLHKYRCSKGGSSSEDCKRASWTCDRGGYSRCVESRSSVNAATSCRSDEPIVRKKISRDCCTFCSTTSSEDGETRMNAGFASAQILRFPSWGLRVRDPSPAEQISESKRPYSQM